MTTGILNQLHPQELEAVLAHEMTHILNRDMLVMTVATFFSMVAALLIVQNFFWISMMGGWRRYGGGATTSGEGLLLALARLGCHLCAELHPDPRALPLPRVGGGPRLRAHHRRPGEPRLGAAAHQRQHENPRIPEQDFREAQAVNALFIVPALRGDSLRNLFSTHPSVRSACPLAGDAAADGARERNA